MTRPLPPPPIPRDLYHHISSKFSFSLYCHFWLCCSVQAQALRCKLAPCSGCGLWSECFVSHVAIMWIFLQWEASAKSWPWKRWAAIGWDRHCPGAFVPRTPSLQLSSLTGVWMLVASWEWSEASPSFSSIWCPTLLEIPTDWLTWQTSAGRCLDWKARQNELPPQAAADPWLVSWIVGLCDHEPSKDF